VCENNAQYRFVEGGREDILQAREK